MPNEFISKAESKFCKYCKKDVPVNKFKKGSLKCSACEWSNYREKHGIRNITVYKPYEKNGEIFKICTICNVEKKLDKFVKSKRISCGVFSFCKDCANARVRAKRAAKNSPKPVIIHNDVKPCSLCGEEKLLKSFARYQKQDGNFSYSARCCVCKNGKRENKTNIKKRPLFESNGELFKVCSKCEVAKNIYEFHKNNTVKSGVQAVCKTCKNNVVYKKRRKPLLNFSGSEQRCLICKTLKPYSKFDKRIRRTDLSVGYNKHCMACCAKKYSKERGKKQRERIKNNPEIKKRYYKLAYASQAKRRAVKRNSPFAFLITKDEIIKRNGLICYLCNKNLTLKTVVLEHYIPLSRGGSHKPENIGIACAECNGRKYNKTVTEFKKWRGDYERFQPLQLNN